MGVVGGERGGSRREGGGGRLGGILCVLCFVLPEIACSFGEQERDPAIIFLEVCL